MKQPEKRPPEPDRVRVDVWLWRARFCKTRAASSRLVSEGGVRVMRDELARRLDKPSQTVACGDTLVFPQDGALRMVKVTLLGERRGPPAEAKTLYADLDGELRARLDGLS
jgi:ribosome-associated heat shock protein Hsp15